MNKLNRNDLPYRPCVGIVLVSPKGLIFAGKRIDGREHGSRNAWQMPQGGIDSDENPRQAAFRELAEETGVEERHVSLLGCTSDWLHYDVPDSLIPKLWGGRFRGQKQLWFAFRYLANDDHINIQTDHPEFKEWRWLEQQQLIQLIVPFKRQVYQQVFEELGQHW